jgi:glutamate racemase
LVPLIEEGKLDEALEIVYPIISELLDKGGDSIILGCTHYALLKEGINERYSERLMVFSQDEIIPKKIYQYLQSHPEIECLLSTKGIRNVHLSKHTNRYDHVLQDLLGGKLLVE